MMKFHAPSFLLGVGVTAAAVAAKDRLRPVAVEIAALGVHLTRVARSVVARRREDLEDIWAEVSERVQDRARAHAPGSAVNGASVAAREAGHAAS